jgi:putative ABC transport system permease protein
MSGLGHVNTPSTFGNRAALRIAWRESRASAGKFLFVIFAVAMGVGSLTGVKGFSRAFHNMLLKEARTLMAADLMVRVFALPSPAQQAALVKLDQQGVERTWITETITMLSSTRQDGPLILGSVKAVDPKVYPFYGQVKLDPPASLGSVLTPDSVAVSRDLLVRMDEKIGDRLIIGGQEFTIAAMVESEPDRMSGSLNVGPRVLMSRTALDRAGLMVPGSRASERFLFKVAPSGVEKLHGDLKRLFPEALVTDFRQSHPTVEQGLERATVFLSLVSLIALIVGALGVSMVINSHLQQKMDSIAIMKCLGARAGQIMRIYTIQTLGLGLAGGLLGIVAGLGVQALFPFFISRYFQIRPHLSLDPSSAVQGLAIGVLAALLFTVPPLLSIRRIRPGLILRRDVTPERRTWFQRLLDARASLCASFLILAGIGGIAAWLSDSWKTGAFFAGGLAGSLAAMAAVAWLLLRGLRWFGRNAAWRLRPSFRHGIANLYRPGSHSQASLVALGIGVMFTLTVFLVQRGLIADMMRDAPPGMPNVFLLDMTPANRDAVLQVVAHQKGVEATPESVGAVAVKMAAIDGVPLVREKLKGMERHYASTVSGDESAKPLPFTKIVEGRWWDPVHAPSNEVSVSEDAAKVMHLKPGMKIDWTTGTRNFRATVAAIHRTETIRMNARIEFTFSPGTLAGLPIIYYGSVRMNPKLVAEMQKAVYAQFPTVAVVNMADVLAIVQDVVDQIAIVIRFISLFTILAGAIILASSVAGTRFGRIREVVILKTLGATRRRIAEIFSIEFLILGAVAGLAGSLLATGFSSLLLRQLLKAEVHLDSLPNLYAVLLTAAIANLAGWLASLRILSQRPLEILREQ